MASVILIKIGSHNGLLSDGTKPLKMLADHQRRSVASTSEQFHKRYLEHQALKFKYPKAHRSKLSDFAINDLDIALLSPVYCGKMV